MDKLYQVGTNSQTFKARHFQNGDKFCKVGTFVKVGTFGQHGDVFMFSTAVRHSDNSGKW